jgi:predicted amidohydrolase YtcJ
MIILDKNPLKASPSEIKEIKVLETIKDGVIVYRRQ